MKERRLYLFDIDGTLINTGGAGGSAMKLAFAALWGVEDGFAGIEFSGRTDRVILRDALTATACSQNSFDHDVQRFKRAYLRRLTSTLATHKGQVLPGVLELLEALRADEHATVGLATGNFRRGAGLKLRHYGIDGYFSAGGFGDTADSREEMLEQALRACRPFGSHDTIFVIGDTVHDVTSAKSHGAVAVGVATGPANARVLAAAGADIVLETLEEAPKHLLGT